MKNKLLFLVTFFIFSAHALQANEKSINLKEIKETDNILLKITYASENNFLGYRFYNIHKAYIIPEALPALKKIAAELKKEELGIIIFDAYRPFSITKKMWQLADRKQKKFLANPFKGASVHNRGAAIDLTLFNIKTKKALSMPSEYDETSPRANRKWQSYSLKRMNNSEKLKKIMEKYGFFSIEEEWWHFNWKNWQNYPVVDIPLEKITISQ